MLSHGRCLSLLLMPGNRGPGMQVQPQAAVVRLEGEAGAVPHGHARRVADLVHADGVQLEEPGQHEHGLLHGKPLTDAPAGREGTAARAQDMHMSQAAHRTCNDAAAHSLPGVAPFRG